MSRPRKTIAVADLMHDLQRALLKAKGMERQQTLVFVIEDLLAKTDNYKGFQFVDENGDWLKPDQMHRADVGGDCYYRRVYYVGES